ncbi:hypothetical protein DPMN_014458 [Dreissena polymorpha]|uniref:GTP-binding protein Rhes n=1 Tax=Dreissena polymorpha TaxID=45954 RepID=A0A9D4N9E8_DREPO|nr:hypothetical protein DPMN_014458 [Dreissena polymorpha]
MGAAGVGKTAIIQQALRRQFLEEYKETIEEQFYYNGNGYILEITDTSGSHHFPEMIRMAILEADMFVLVLSVTDWSTFDRVALIRKQICELRDNNVPIIVVGNKSDLSSNREISPEVADAVVCIDWSCRYHDVTARSYDSVCEVFTDVLNTFPELYGKHVDLSDTKVAKKRSESQANKSKRMSKLRKSISSICRKIHSLYSLETSKHSVTVSDSSIHDLDALSIM